MAQTPSANDLTRQQLDELDALLQRMLAQPTALAEPRNPAPVPVPAPAPASAPAPLPSGWRFDAPVAVEAERAPHVTLPAAIPEEQPEPEPSLALNTGMQGLARPEFSPGANSGIPMGMPINDPQPGMITGSPIAEPKQPLWSEPAASFAEATRTESDEGSTADASTDAVPLTVAVEPSETPAAITSGNMEPMPTPEPARLASVSVVFWPLFALNWCLELILGFFGPPGQSLRTTPAKNLLGGVGILLIIAAAIWTARGFGLIQIP